MLSFNITK